MVWGEAAGGRRVHARLYVQPQVLERSSAQLRHLLAAGRPKANEVGESIMRRVFLNGELRQCRVVERRCCGTELRHLLAVGRPKANEVGEGIMRRVFLNGELHQCRVVERRCCGTELRHLLPLDALKQTGG